MSKPPKNALPLHWYLGAHLECEIPRQCQRDELICWARRGSRDGPWSQLPESLWPYLRIVSHDFICRQELISHRKRIKHSEINGGRPIFVEEETLDTVEMWFDPRFAPAETIVQPRGHRERVVFARPIEAWVRDVYAPQFRGARPPSRDQMTADVRAKFGDAVPSDRIRTLKAKYLKGRGGRPKSGGE